MYTRGGERESMGRSRSLLARCCPWCVPEELAPIRTSHEHGVSSEDRPGRRPGERSAEEVAAEAARTQEWCLEHLSLESDDAARALEADAGKSERRRRRLLGRGSSASGASTGFHRIVSLEVRTAAGTMSKVVSPNTMTGLCLILAVISAFCASVPYAEKR